MAHIAPELKTKLKRDPQALVKLIVRLKDAPDKRIADLKARGLDVRRIFTLISAVAVQGSAETFLALANESWVLSVEEDKPVHTLR
jgi:hypothetical protein